jgi:hypothetical protein
LPSVRSNTTSILQLLDEMENHPGLSAVVGVPEMKGGRFLGYNIPGSPAAGFQALFDQFEGDKYKQAYESLKGAGQITEFEAKTVANSISNMQTAQSETEFKKALNKYRSVMKKALQRAEIKAGVKPGSTTSNQTINQPSEEIDYTEILREVGQ